MAEREVFPGALFETEGVFLTNSIRGVVPVGHLEELALPLGPKIAVWKARMDEAMRG